MDPIHRDALIFAAPGIVHRLGNAMFTVQGQAQLLAAVGPEARERRSILSATERASRTLALMRALLGHHHGHPECASKLLSVLADVLGVSVRQGGHTISASAPEDNEFRGIDPGVFLPAMLEAVRLLVGVLPAGQSGHIEIRLVDGDRGRIVVRIRFEVRDGSLPFPLATREIHVGLGRALHAIRPQPTIHIVDKGLDLVFGGMETLGAGAES